VADHDIANHAGVQNIDPAHYGNAVTIGIEQEHIDGKDDWPDSQVKRTAAIVAHILQTHPNLTLSNVLGHSDVAPEHKVDPVNYPWAKFRQYVGEFMGGEVPGVPHHGRYAQESGGGEQSESLSAAGQEAKRRAALASTDHVMKEEGASGLQDGRREIFGFREGQDSEYPALARLRAAGDEEGVRRIAASGIIDRAIKAGSQQFNDLGVKAALMSLSHMRGPSGATAIMNGVGTGRLDKSGRAAGLDPQAVATINQMPRSEVMRRLEIARIAYDRAILGEDYWDRFGRGLSDRYQRERAFYSELY
jgi:hypothetical protein